MTLPQHLVATLGDAHAGDVVVVDGDEAHHAVVVRRLRVGERVQLCDGAGRVAVGVVSDTSKRSFSVEVADVADVAEPAPRITVVQALPKGDRGELAVEVLTEIGVARIVPWAAARSVAVWKGERAAKSRAKWAATAREAAKQSRRAWHPEVAPLATTAEVAAIVAAAGVALVLHEEAAAGLREVAIDGTEDLVLIVGPEGGVTGEEVDRFIEAGGHAVRLGSEVLRTSTAGLAAVAALLADTARWNARA